MNPVEKTGMGQLAPLLPFLKRHWLKLSIGFLCMVVQNYYYMRIPQLVQQVVDEIVGQNRAQVIGHSLVWLAVFSLIMAISLFAMRALIIGVSREIEFSLRERIFEGILSKPLSFFNKYATGDLLSRSSNDLADVRLLLGPGIMYIPNSLSRLAFFFPVLLSLSPRLLLWVGGLLFLLILMITLLLPRLRPLYLATQQEAARLNERVWQTLRAGTTIALFQSEGVEKKRFDLVLGDYYRAQMNLVKHKEYLWPLFIFVFSLTEAITLLIGGRQVMAGTMTLGELLQFNLMISFLTFPVLSIGWVMSSLQQGITAMSRINTILKDVAEIPALPTPIRDQLTHIQFKGLNFSYPDAPSLSLHNIDLDIHSGDILGLTGTVASGKTSLLKVLGGLQPLAKGMLFFDGQDVTDMGVLAQMAAVSYVTENPFLFSRSIAENIALGESEIDMDRVKLAATWAGLDPDLERFPDGLGQVIGERGLTLSGGQRQRVGLARALYRRAPLLLLDDPLSHVDAETETRILSHLRQVPWVKMLVLVSHRISTLKLAEHIAVLDKGHLIEWGSHQSLLLKNGLYAHLAELQQLREE